MQLPRLANEPDWKLFLRLGEKLLDQPNAPLQVNVIEETIRTIIGAEVDVWLKEPFYPLPGEPVVKIYNHDLASECVKRSIEEKKTVICQTDQPNKKRSINLACPLITQNHMLGVLDVYRPDGPPFKPEEVTFLEGLASHSALSLQVNRQVAIKNWRYEQIALVRSVSSQIANLTDLDQLCKRITKLIQQSFHYYYIAIFTLDAGDNYLHFRASALLSEKPEVSPALKIKVGDGIIGWVAQEGKEFHSKDVTQEPRFRYLDRLPETRSEISLPIKIENRILGVLDVQSTKSDNFHEIDVLVLRALADNISLAVEGARLYSDTEKRAEQIQSVYEVSHALSSILDLDTLLDQVVALIQQKFGYPYVHLFTAHGGRRKLFYRAGFGITDKDFYTNPMAFDLDSEKGIVSWVARNGKTHLANDVSKDLLYISSPIPPVDTKSELSIPLKYSDEVLGVLDIQSKETNAFNPYDLSLFEALAASISVAIHNASMYRSEQWRRQVADSFRDVANLLSANVELDKLLDMILVELEKNLPCDTSAIWLLDELYDPSVTDGQPLRLAAGRGTIPQKLIKARDDNTMTRDWIDRALLAKEPVIRQPSDPFGPLGIANNYPLNYSSIAAPLKSGEQILGIITLAHKTSGRYGSEAKMMTETFASYAAVAIQNARLFASAQAEAWTSTVLLQVSEASQSYTNLDDLLATMARVTPLMVGVKKSAIFLWDETQEGFELKASYGIPEEAQHLLYTDDTAPALRMLRELKTPLYIQNPSVELNFPELDSSVDHSTIILIPLMARGEILGALLVFHQIDNKMEISNVFNEQNLAILQGIAHQTSVAIENIKLIEARQEEAYVTAVLLQVAQAVVSQNELNDILDTVVHLLPILVGVDTSLLYLYDPALGVYHPTKAYMGSHSKETEILKRSFAEGEYPLLDRIKTSDKPVIYPLDDPDLPAEEWHTISYPSSENSLPTPRQLAAGSFLIGFPLSVKGELYGVMLNKESHVPATFHDRRMEIMTGIAQQISLAIQNERLKQEMVGRERLEREFQLARQIQKTFLPNELPNIHGWEMDIRWQTAREVGGDFYDIFKLNNDLYGLAIADVSDKGMPAALYMTVTRTLIRSTAQNEKSPARVLSRVNTLLMLDQQNAMFVTAIYATLNIKTGELIISNAGHNQPILYRAETNSIEILPRGELALGVLDRIKYVDHILCLNPNDNLVLYTDGVTESFSKTGEPFGEERLGELILNSRHDSICRLLEEIEKANTDFRGGEPPSDDLTLLAIRRLTDENTAQC